MVDLGLRLPASGENGTAHYVQILDSVHPALLINNAVTRLSRHVRRSHYDAHSHSLNFKTSIEYEWRQLFRVWLFFDCRTDRAIAGAALFPCVASFLAKIIAAGPVPQAQTLYTD
jgi:hypothetical protein